MLLREIGNIRALGRRSPSTVLVDGLINLRAQAGLLRATGWLLLGV